MAVEWMIFKEAVGVVNTARKLLSNEKKELFEETLNTIAGVYRDTALRYWKDSLHQTGQTRADLLEKVADHLENEYSVHVTALKKYKIPWFRGLMHMSTSRQVPFRNHAKVDAQLALVNAAIYHEIGGREWTVRDRINSAQLMLERYIAIQNLLYNAYGDYYDFTETVREQSPGLYVHTSGETSKEYAQSVYRETVEAILVFTTTAERLTGETKNIAGLDTKRYPDLAN